MHHKHAAGNLPAVHFQTTPCQSEKNLRISESWNLSDSECLPYNSSVTGLVSIIARWQSLDTFSRVDEITGGCGRPGRLRKPRHMQCETSDYLPRNFLICCTCYLMQPQDVCDFWGEINAKKTHLHPLQTQTLSSGGDDHQKPMDHVWASP